MTQFPFETAPSSLPNIGLIALQTDETIEPEFHRLFSPDDVNLYVSRIPSGKEVTTETLGEMSSALPQAASLFPSALSYDAIAYGCTSGTSVIGPEKVADHIKSSANAIAVTEPVTALVEACTREGIKRLAFLSPYVESVSAKLSEVLLKRGVTTPVFGSFNEADDATVAKINSASVLNAAKELAANAEIDGLFMSCTNLKTIHLINELEHDLKVPVLSSNLVLAQHLAKLSGVKLLQDGQRNRAII